MLENYEVLESIETSFLFIGKKLVDFLSCYILVIKSIVIDIIFYNPYKLRLQLLRH